MADFVSKEKRSKIMRGVRSKNTRPELRVRSLLHAKGYRFRVHRKDLPGKPDITLSRHRAIVFVHGCFWHNHEGCSHGRIPTSNREFWEGKISRNKARDVRNAEALRALGWRVFVVWECELQDEERLLARLDCGLKTLQRVNGECIADQY